MPAQYHYSSAYIKWMSGSFGNPLAQFTGDAGAPLHMKAGSQNPLQNGEGIGFGCVHYTTLANDQRVD